MNLGEAAHITAASPGGARFNPDLSPSERASAGNGIWLCPTCAALIDRDDDRYPEPKLREWKADAEAAAALALEERQSPPLTESAGVLLEAERLMAALIGEMRADVRSDDTELVREFYIAPTLGIVVTGKPRFFYVEEEHPGLQLQVDWLEEMGLVSDITTDRFLPMYRMTPELVEWLRRPDDAAR